MGDGELGKRDKRLHSYHKDEEGYSKDIETASLLLIVRLRWA
jgi:hypothetical protein